MTDKQYLDVVETIKYHPWIRPMRYDVQLSNATLAGWFTSKTGKEVLMQFYCRAIITKDDEAANKDSLEELKSAKKSIQELTLVDLVRQYLEERRGVKGHRGFFKFQNFRRYSNGS